MDKGAINVFEVKVVRKQIGYKISAADVFNQFLYLGDEKGNIHSYPIRAGESQVISRTENDNSKSVSKSRIDKILCYKQISTILVLTGESLLAIDSGFKKSQLLGSKIADFALNQSFDKQLIMYSVVAVSKKKEGFIFVYDPTQKKLVEKARFSVSQVPNCLTYTGKFVVLANKKDYESLNIQKQFALMKGPLQAKFPFVRAVAPSQILCVSDEIGLLMSPQFQPKPKDSINLNKPIQQISISGNYCFILCDTVLLIYLNYDKKFSFIQQIPINMAKGITNNRPFVYNKDDLYFLYEIPYETQIKGLLDRCRVDDAISLLIQKVGSDNQQKIEQLKIQAIWPLLKKMQFDKTKDLAKTPSFDIRQLIFLYPELLSMEMESMKGAKTQKTMATLIVQFVNEKAQKGKNEQMDLKQKSKLFLKQVLLMKRQFYLAQGVSGKIKKSFARAKNSFIKGPLPSVTSEQLLEIIDFTLFKWFMDMGRFSQLQQFLLANSVIYCQKYFSSFEQNFRKNEKLMQVPTLKPRLFAAFNKYNQAFANWQAVAQKAQKQQKQQIIKTSCQEAVNLLTKFQDKNGIQDKLDWILQLKPDIAMSFFAMIPFNILQADKVVKKFEKSDKQKKQTKQKNDKFLQLFLETLVNDRGTQIQAYHTKLMLLYLDGLFKLHSKQNKEQSKNLQFQDKLIKFRKLQKNPNVRYAAQPILKKIQRCEWLLQDEIYLYSRQKRHEQALKRYISKNMPDAAVKYCEQNGQQTLTIYFKMLLAMYKSYEASKNSAALICRKDIIIFLTQHASSPQLDPLTVLQLIPDQWMLNDGQGILGVYPFLQSAITHTLHQKRSNYTAKHLSQMDLLNVQYNLVQAKKAYLRFTIKKKCCICGNHIADKFFVVYPNANVCHQACVKKDKNSNTVCPITKQDFQKTFKY